MKHLCALFVAGFLLMGIPRAFSADQGIDVRTASSDLALHSVSPLAGLTVSDSDVSDDRDLDRDPSKMLPAAGPQIAPAAPARVGTSHSNTFSSDSVAFPSRLRAPPRSIITLA